MNKELFVKHIILLCQLLSLGRKNITGSLSILFIPGPQSPALMQKKQKIMFIHVFNYK